MNVAWAEGELRVMTSWWTCVSVSHTLTHYAYSQMGKFKHMQLTGSLQHTHTHTQVIRKCIVRSRQTHSQNALSKIKISLCSWTWRYESSLSSQPVAWNIKRLSAFLQLPGSSLSLCMHTTASLHFHTHSPLGSNALTVPQGPALEMNCNYSPLFLTVFCYYFIGVFPFSLYSPHLLQNLSMRVSVCVWRWVFRQL